MTVLYDEGCGFCTDLAAWLARRPGLRVASIGSAEGVVLLRDLTPAQRYDAVHVVDADGRRRTGGAALPPVLRLLPYGGVPSGILAALPGATERAYRLVARQRGLVSRTARVLLRGRAAA